MQQADELEKLVLSVHSQLLKVQQPDWHAKPNPAKWSKLEVLGHLVDSAQNNLRRFVVSQYQQNDKIVYSQDDWVKCQKYHQADIGELISLWLLLNKQLVRTLREIPEGKLANTCDTGKEHAQLHTLAFLAEDYIVHLKHHLRQILRDWTT